VLDLVYRREALVLMVLDRLDSVLDRLRLDPATAATPVLVCTTTPRTLEGLQGREAEALSVLAKPFDLERLLARLAAMLAAQPSPPRGWEEAPGVRLPRRSARRGSAPPRTCGSPPP
jgi:DNA-binding response OmpR family regulator